MTGTDAALIDCNVWTTRAGRRLETGPSWPMIRLSTGIAQRSKTGERELKIAAVKAGHFRLPLPVPVGDSTHGDMTEFDLVTVRVVSDTGDEGLGLHLFGPGGRACDPHPDRKRPHPAAPRRGPQPDRASLGDDVAAASLAGTWGRGRSCHVGCRYSPLGPEGALGRAAFVAAPGRALAPGHRLRRRHRPELHARAAPGNKRKGFSKEGSGRSR